MKNKEKNYKKINECLACGNGDIVQVLNLKEQPLANSYHDNTVQLPAFPLSLNVCNKCFHSQQVVSVDPDLMFKDYSYVSGTSQTLRDYFSQFVKEVNKRYEHILPKHNKSVLDIACNDGTQLEAFIKDGWDAYGVDPAENLIERSRSTGSNVSCAYWDVSTAKSFNKKFDILVAQNVFAHVSNPKDFLEACKTVMHDDSKLFIQTSQADMIPHGEFDTIYHEHISFFSVRSMLMLAGRAGLTLEDVYIAPIHGGSYVFVLGYGEVKPSVKERLDFEDKEGRYAMSFFEQFADIARTSVKQLKETITNYKDKSYTVVGFGAAAKGNTLLNFGNIELEYIIDDNPLKQGLHTPGMNIPIHSIDSLEKETDPIVVVPLAWNFYDEIYKKVKKVRPNMEDVFITYFPSVEVHE